MFFFLFLPLRPNCSTGGGKIPTEGEREEWRRKTKQGSEQANGLSGPDDLSAKRSGAEASDRISSLPTRHHIFFCPSWRSDRGFCRPSSPVDPTTHCQPKNFTCSLALTFACHTLVRRDASSLQQLQEVEARVLGIRPHIQTHSATAAATATAAAAAAVAVAAATTTTARSSKQRKFYQPAGRFDPDATILGAEPAAAGAVESLRQPAGPDARWRSQRQPW